MKKALIIVDPQIDFISGSLAVPDASSIIPIINSIDKNKFDCVILTADNHPANHIAFASQHEGKNPLDVIIINGKEEVLWPDHCIQGTHGQHFHPDLNLDIKELYIFKKGENPNFHPYSGFAEIPTENTTTLAEFLKARDIKATFICGLATDYCVKDTALDSVKEGFKTFLLLDACRGIAEDLTENNFELMNKGVTLLDTDELMTDGEILRKIRLDRPEQVIHDVISWKKNKYGFYNVKVDMISNFLGTKVMHAIHVLPYPMIDYAKLSEKEQFEWRMENM